MIGTFFLPSLSGDPFQAPVQKLDLSEADADKANAEAPSKSFTVLHIFAEE